MKMVFVMHTVGRTGGHRVVLEYCNRLKVLGHTVSVVALGLSHDHRWFPLRVPIGYSRLGRFLNLYNDALVHTPSLPRWDDLERLCRLIPDCDIAVATYCLTASAVWRSPRCTARAYFTQHFEPYFFHDDYLKRWALETYHLPIAKAANSSWLKDRIREATGQEVSILTPGINTSIFYARRTSVNRIKRRIVAFSKPVAWKGFEDLIRAVKVIESRRNDFELVTFGDWTPPRLPLSIRASHIVSPSDEELAQLYSSAEILVCPSRYESFPLPPLEAMACGTPVVTTSVGTEDFARNYENSLVVPPSDPQALARAVMTLMDDESLQDRLRRNGLETARRNDWDKAAARMERFLLGVGRGSE